MISKNYTFNSPLELGTRVALILTAIDEKLDVNQLVLLDYALIYSREFNGPVSLHPEVPNHVAELAHRQEFLSEALSLFVRKGIVSTCIDEHGISYFSNEQTLAFISSLKSVYYRKCWVRLDWLIENYDEILQYKVSELCMLKK